MLVANPDDRAVTALLLIAAAGVGLGVWQTTTGKEAWWGSFFKNATTAQAAGPSTCKGFNAQLGASAPPGWAPTQTVAQLFTAQWGSNAFAQWQAAGGKC